MAAGLSSFQFQRVKNLIYGEFNAIDFSLYPIGYCGMTDIVVGSSVVYKAYG